MKSILIVDDKPEIAKIIMIYLSSSIKWCIWKISKSHFMDERGKYSDGIISDLNMPEMSGERIRMLFKRNNLFNHIPILVLSSEESSSTRIRLLEEGAEDFIIKPFNPEELRIRIKRLVK